MLIIMSGAYIDQEFGAEFGAIPPAFLPIGNQRLFVHQAQTLPADEPVVLTVPESYQVSPFDQRQLKELGIKLLSLPAGQSLGEAVVCAINLAGNPPDAPVRILHGDTLILDLPKDQLDVITLSEVDGAYDWAVWHEGESEVLAQLEFDPITPTVNIANGYFAFSDSGLFVRSIIQANGSFVKGINAYAREQALSPVHVEHWFDFGHANTYFRSKARITTERAFNQLHINPKTVRKTSPDTKKMQAEANWFANLPPALRVYAPQVINDFSQSESGYATEYMYQPALNELFVFGQQTRFTWRKIFNACFEFIDECQVHQPLQAMSLTSDSLFVQKTQKRLKQFVEQRSHIDLSKPWALNGQPIANIETMLTGSAERLASLDFSKSNVMHGDLCFSNIFYDFRTQAIKVIDPRGTLPNNAETIYGSSWYDLAKLAHSVCGLYDFIMAGHYDLGRTGRELSLTLPESSQTEAVQQLFLTMMAERYQVSAEPLWAMQVHLFLSMLPLHADDTNRQLALLANAMRAYLLMEEASHDRNFDGGDEQSVLQRRVH